MALMWSVLEPAPFRDDYGYWPNAIIEHRFADEAQARDFARYTGWEVVANFAPPITVDVPVSDELL